MTNEKVQGGGCPDRNSRSLPHVLQHIDRADLSKAVECETALNRSLMDPRDERTAAPLGKKGGQEGVWFRGG